MPLIHNEVTREPSDTTKAVVQYFSFSVGNDTPISYFTLTEDFSSSDGADKRDIFSIDDLTFSTQRNALTGGGSAPDPAPTNTPPTATQQPIPDAKPTTPPPLPNGGLDLTGQDIANINFTEFTPESIANTDWDSFGFAEITPGSIAAQSLDWGDIPYESLGPDSALTLDPKSIDPSKLNIDNVRQIRSNNFLSGSSSTPFSVTKGENTNGSDSQLDIIISGGNSKTIKATGGEGPDLFIIPKTNGPKMKAKDFEPGVDAVLFDIPPKATRKLQLETSGNKTTVLFKDNPLLIVPFKTNDIQQIIGTDL